MRLIDAKELFSKVGDIKPANSQQYHDIIDFMNMITNQPTIKAIPIEVLEEIKDAIKKDKILSERLVVDVTSKGVYYASLSEYAVIIIDKCIAESEES